jgi:uncharacterized oxidoreductase
MVEILGSALAGLATTDPTVVGNGLCFVVVDPDAFCPIAEFRRLVDGTVAYVKSSQPRPGVDEVLVPGEIEFRTQRRRLAEGIPVDDSTWQAIEDCARARRIDLAHLLPG